MRQVLYPWVAKSTEWMNYSEDLHTIVTKVNNNDVTIWSYGDTRGPVHLARTCTGYTKLAQEVAIWREDLHTVVSRISYDNMAFRINGNTWGRRNWPFPLPSEPRKRADWKSGWMTSKRWLLKSVTTMWPSWLNATPRGESKCFHNAPSKPYLLRNVPSRRNNWIRWLRVSDTRILPSELTATSQG